MCNIYVHYMPGHIRRQLQGFSVRFRICTCTVRLSKSHQRKHVSGYPFTYYVEVVHHSRTCSFQWHWGRIWPHEVHVKGSSLLASLTGQGKVPKCSKYEGKGWVKEKEKGGKEGKLEPIYPIMLMGV